MILFNPLTARDTKKIWLHLPLLWHALIAICRADLRILRPSVTQISLKSLSIADFYMRVKFNSLTHIPDIKALV